MVLDTPRNLDTSQASSLLYHKPSTEWSQALPIGNGRLGAMVHGRTDTELLQLNEDSVWYGGPQDRKPRDALQKLPLLRQLIREERHAEAEELIRTAFFATPASMRHYEPLGSCSLEFGHGNVVDYVRSLDISRSVCKTSYTFHPVKVRRDVIASFPDQVLLMRVETSQKIRFIVRLNRGSEIEWETNEFLDSIDATENRIVLQATPGGRNSNRLALVLGIRCDDSHEGGSVEAVGNCLLVNSAACMIAVGAQTTYRTEAPEKDAVEDVNKALRQGWDDLLARHVADYRSLYDRVSLQMWPDSPHIPTDERIARHRNPGLVALYHNFGRYLLISCSRDGHKALPANLQGIWNPSFAPPWGSKYTININIQMNYWPVAASNLLECALPLVDLLERMAQRGRETAQTMYGCKGWCAHHNTDIWADTDPQDRWMPATLWPLGGVWICIDMMKLVRERYDRALHERLAPVLEGCVEFLLDFLITSECGRYLVTNPSLSPENTFLSNGKPGILCEGSTIDISIVDMAFEYFLWTVAKLYGGEHPLAERVQEARLPPVQINEQGLIQEWGLKDHDEYEPGHRHVSHLFGLYPGNSIRSPQELEGARKVLARRAAHGGGHTGWSRAWLLCMHARLRDAEGCGKHMDLLLRDSTLPNMLDNHPPFQIDGNLGGCAGILECLARRWEPSLYETGVTLLPSRPKEWSRGRLTGLHVRDGWTISFEWSDGEIVDPVIVNNTTSNSDPSISMAVKYPNGRVVSVQGSGEHRITQADANFKHGKCGDFR
ncbi:family 95 glycoside hydrolase [Cryphonectria parasitica EP155]|uniref:Family 95 glycoside hydrolase n=1 Tax=Cryphonectria parasitica (strain ATCC 38755 / EP155) TaxID=660469 RepID=A0A9P4Y9Z2_CRYP1|nr:family 95 glycoside hydrolase [Cryphonectria parasitica EP155]KAF3769501.1 family 95 glycoside hydrolase [Cryphonectria parasitica EP155]